MKFKIPGTLVLIAASILCIWVVGIVIFAGAYFIEGISYGNLEPVGETLRDFFSLLCLILFVISTIVAWFNRITGSILMSLFGIFPIILAYEPEIVWIQISILFVGPLLLITEIFMIKQKDQNK